MAQVKEVFSCCSRHADCTTAGHCVTDIYELSTCSLRNHLSAAVEASIHNKKESVVSMKTRKTTKAATAPTSLTDELVDRVAQEIVNGDLLHPVTSQTPTDDQQDSNPENQVCPVCGEEFFDEPALSRRDNKTLICSDCGIREAFEDAQNSTKPASVDDEDSSGPGDGGVDLEAMTAAFNEQLQLAVHQVTGILKIANKEILLTDDSMQAVQDMAMAIAEITKRTRRKSGVTNSGAPVERVSLGPYWNKVTHAYIDSTKEPNVIGFRKYLKEFATKENKLSKLTKDFAKRADKYFASALARKGQQ